MTKKYTVSDADIKHYSPPHLTGRIVGKREESLRPQTVEEIEELQKQAFEEASQRGFKKGYDDGHQKGHEEMLLEAEAFKEKAKHLIDMMEFLQHPLKQMDEEVEHQLSQLAVVLAKCLLKKDTAIDAEHIYKLVHDSLDYLPVKARDIRIRLHPDDIALLNQADFDTSDQSWQCVADSTITAGGCLIESDASHIDATLETRVQQLIEQMELHQTEDDEDATS